MNASRTSLLWINVIGGIAVLGSYAYGLSANPLSRDEVWGGVPDTLRPLYTASMLTAAAGYFAFSYFVFFRLDAAAVNLFGVVRGWAALNVLYALILAPSALWMPLTFAMLETPGTALWWSIRLVLALVALGSVGLLGVLAGARPRSFSAARVVALVGCAAFVFQTAVLDALVWTAYFPA